jgi:hypothetical protein
MGGVYLCLGVSLVVRGSECAWLERIHPSSYTHTHALSQTSASSIHTLMWLM